MIASTCGHASATKKPRKSLRGFFMGDARASRVVYNTLRKNSRVRSCLGAAKICSGSPSSMMTP